MCPSIALLGDIGTGHDGFPPTPVIAASPDVFLDGKPVARQGDSLACHSATNTPPHPRSIAGGVNSVLVNGKPIAVTGTGVDCGGVIIGSGSGQAG
ncbi:type VI secretion system PAAR protein [Aeromonas veronii]|uniref:type VI secretion system PAAR protein n=1 Tax=Aeromonas veronii TaxID=654 RepID=UPI003D25E500